VQIDQTTLPGGLTVVTARLADFETAAIMVVVRAGSRDETPDNNGIAHFLEHMAFKGTATRSAFDIAVEIECLGAQINAFTSQEMTTYMIVGLKDAVADALAILGDVLLRSRYAPEDIALERNVITQEIARMGDDPSAVCNLGFLATAYPDHPIGRPVLGTAAFVAAAERADLLDFVTRHYNAHETVVVATGDVEHRGIVELAERHLGGLPGDRAAAARTAPFYAGGFYRHVRDDFKQVSVALGFPSVAVDTPGFYAHKLLSVAMGHGISSPLFQEVRHKRGLVYGVGAHSTHGSDFGLLGIWGGMTQENLRPFLEVICAEALRTTDAVQERDFIRARNVALAELATVKERPFQLGMYLAGQFFRHGRATGPEVDLEMVRAVTINDLRDAARKVFAGAPTLSLVGPIEETDHLATVRAALQGA
jgi:predicted Zn-dependent peptidase